jgi:hypothetical protein
LLPENWAIIAAETAEGSGCTEEKFTLAHFCPDPALFDIDDLLPELAETSCRAC